MSQQKIELNYMWHILSTESVSRSTTAMSDMIQTILDQIPNVTYEIDETGNIIARKGISDIYPGVACHIDTVHNFVKKYRVRTDGHKYWATDGRKKPAGIGGDDKCGIIICLNLLEQLDVCKAFFFVDEEIGCIGSGIIDHEHFDNVGYVIEFDRKGNSDLINSIWGCITSEEFDEEILETITNMGYQFTEGNLTDIAALKDNINISMINMSCGYYNPHTNEEYIVINDLKKAFLLGKKLIKKLGNKLYPHMYMGYYSDYDSNLLGDFNRYKYCPYCGSILENYTQYTKQCFTCGGIFTEY